MMKATLSDVDELAERTADAFSANGYPNGEWEALCARLLDAGFTPKQAEEVLRSRITRWARDHYGDDDYHGTADHVMRYLVEHQRDAITCVFTLTARKIIALCP